MGVEQRLTPLIQSFFFEGREQPVSFVETTHVSDGVECDVYEFRGVTTKDLWEADPDSSLMAYEVCFPPYEDGRYENIDES